jgi:hypothetical protein
LDVVEDQDVSEKMENVSGERHFSSGWAARIT